MTVEVENNRESSRYEIRLDGAVIGVADYAVDESRVILPHTEILPAFRGRGYAEQLVRFALDDIRRAGRAIVPSCWYVADFVRAHPEYADLVGQPLPPA